MVNPHRGEVALVVNGQQRTLRLTLGALAAMEARLEVGSLMKLAERFEAGRVGSAELITLLAAGLEGAGEGLGEADLAKADIEGGAVAALRSGMELLALAFLPIGDG